GGDFSCNRNWRARLRLLRELVECAASVAPLRRRWRGLARQSLLPARDVARKIIPKMRNWPVGGILMASPMRFGVKAEDVSRSYLTYGKKKRSRPWSRGRSLNSEESTLWSTMQAPRAVPIACRQPSLPTTYGERYSPPT